MTTSTSDSVMGMVAWGHTCLPVKVEVEQAVFDVDKMSIGLAFFIGLIVSVILTALCCRLCWKDWARKKGWVGNHLKKLLKEWVKPITF